MEIKDNNLSNKAKQNLKRLKTDFRFFLKNAPVKIRDKQSRKEVTFEINEAQEYVLSEMEKMEEEVGFIRVVILKGRQQGVSTLTQARFFWQTQVQNEANCFVLAHQTDTTSNIFRMTKNFLNTMNKVLRKATLSDTNKRLEFAGGSSFDVGTAGSSTVGRGFTTNKFHGSEVAFWDNPQEIMSGVMQAIPLAPGSEVILESTANGRDASFFPMVMGAIKGEGIYRLIFVPWFWQKEYRFKDTSNLKLTIEDKKYQELYDLDDEQMMWRQIKIVELTASEFRREYPANVNEAFMSSEGTLISAENIALARKSERKDPYAPVIIGIDPSAEGKDRTVLAIRQGREVPRVIIYPSIRPMQLVAQVVQLILDLRVDMVFIDVAEGSGAIDRLRELGHGHRVWGVGFGETKSLKKPDVYLNKRCEMWCNMEEWFNLKDVSIPDREDIETDLLTVPPTITTSSNKKKLISKDEIKKIYKFSPDIGDALALTFAYDVAKNSGYGLPGEDKFFPQDNATTTKRPGLRDFLRANG